MATPESKRISELDLATPLTDADFFPVVQDGRTKRTTYAQVRTGAEDGCQCTLVSRYTIVGTDANTDKKYLQTYTLPADTITTDGSWLDIYAVGTFAANGNSKLVSIGFKQNSTGIDSAYSIPLAAHNNDFWEINVRMQRTGETTGMAYKFVNVVANNSGVLQTPAQQLFIGAQTGIDWAAGDLQITVEGTNSTASANDIRNYSFIIVAHLMDANS